MKEQIEQQTAEEERIRKKLQIILPEIIAHRNRDKFPLEPLNDVVGMFECDL